MCKFFDSHSQQNLKISRLGYLGPIFLACLAAGCFLQFDSLTILDKDSYVSTIDQIGAVGPGAFFFLFNGIEVASALIFLLVSLMPISSVYGIAGVIFSYTLIFFNLFKNDRFLFGCFFLIVFGLYLFDFWLSQLRSALAITSIMYLVYKSHKASQFVRIFPVLLHIQSAIYSALLLTDLNSIKKVSVIFGLTLLCCLQIGYFLSLDIAIAEKINFYLYRDLELGASELNSKVTFAKALGFACLSVLHIYLFRKYGIAEVAMICSAIIFISFYDAPTIVGRINSMTVFFEPFVVARHNNVIKSAYILILLFGIFVKWVY